MKDGELDGVMGRETETVAMFESEGIADTLTLSVGDSVPEVDSVPELLKELERVPLSVPVGEKEVSVVADTDALDVDDTLNDGDTDGVADTDEHAVCEIEIVPERVSRSEGEIEVDALNVDVEEATGERVGRLDVDGEGEIAAENETEGDADGEPEIDGELVCVALIHADTECRADTDTERDTNEDPDTVTESVGCSVGENVLIDVAETVPDGESANEAECVTLTVPVREMTAVTDAELELVGIALNVPLTDGERESRTDFVGVIDPDDDTVTEADRGGVIEMGGERESEGDPDIESEPLGLGDTELDTVSDTLTRGDGVVETVPLGVAEMRADPVGGADSVGERSAERVIVAVCDTDEQCDAVGDLTLERDRSGDADEDTDPLSVTVWRMLALSVGDPVVDAEMAGERDADGLDETEPLAEWLFNTDLVTTTETECVGDTVGVGGATVAETDVDRERVKVGSDVEDTLCDPPAVVVFEMNADADGDADIDGERDSRGVAVGEIETTAEAVSGADLVAVANDVTLLDVELVGVDESDTVWHADVTGEALGDPDTVLDTKCVPVATIDTEIEGLPVGEMVAMMERDTVDDTDGVGLSAAEAVGDTETRDVELAFGEREGDPERKGDTEIEGDAVDDPLTEGDAVIEADTFDVADPRSSRSAELESAGDIEIKGDTVDGIDAVALTEIDDDVLGDTVPLTETRADLLSLTDAEFDRESDGVTVPVTLPVHVADPGGERDPVLVTLAQPVDDAETEPQRETVGDGDVVDEREAEFDTVTEPVDDGDSVPDFETTADAVATSCVPEALPEIVSLLVGTDEKDADAVAVLLTSAVGVTRGLPDGGALSVADAESAAVLVIDGDADGDRETELVTVEVTVGAATERVGVDVVVSDADPGTLRESKGDDDDETDAATVRDGDGDAVLDTDTSGVLVGEPLMLAVRERGGDRLLDTVDDGLTDIVRVTLPHAVVDGDDVDDAELLGDAVVAIVALVSGEVVEDADCVVDMVPVT